MSKSDPVILRDAEKYLKEGGSAFNNYVIIGAKGLLGSYLLDFMSQVNSILGVRTNTVGVVRSNSLYLKNLEKRSGVKIEGLDTLESKLLDLDDIHIIHAASPASVAKIMSDMSEILNSNIDLTERIFRILEKTGGRITYFSSGEVYGNSPNYPIIENNYSGFDHLSIRGFYPEVKRFTETKLRIWHELTKIPVTILRIFHTFGPGISADDERIFASTIFDLINKRSIFLNSQGRTRRSFLYSSDLAAGIKVSESNNQFDYFNIAGETEISILEFAQLVQKIDLKRKIEFIGESIELPIHSSPISRGLADTSKLRNLGWNPNVSTFHAIEKTVESTRWRITQGFID
jgi:nucleoside-diphosphate-sugar epimerase